MSDIIIKALTPDLFEDYLNFFDNSAFVDNPKWSACYCFFKQAPHKICDWKDRTAEKNRSAVINLITEGKLYGFIAYDNGKPIGWCNSGPRTNMTTTPDYDEPDANKIGSIVCFIIGKDYRRKGVARLLLKTAYDDFKMQGFNFAEGYPLKDVEGEAANHNGPMDLYLSEGFEQYTTNGDIIVMRKTLF